MDRRDTCLVNGERTSFYELKLWKRGPRMQYRELSGTIIEASRMFCCPYKMNHQLSSRTAIFAFEGSPEQSED